MNKKNITILILIISICAMPLVSAGIFGNIWNSITGKASSGSFNITTITITAANPPTIIYVSPVSPNPVTITEGSYAYVYLNFTVQDNDGAADINDATASAQFNQTGEALRYNSTCTNTTPVTGFTRNYTCRITMWYFDRYDRWDVNVTATDLAGTLATNTTTNFTVASTTGGELAGQAFFNFTGPYSVTSTNSLPQNRLTLLNIGNRNFTLNVTAKNLNGTSRPEEYISPANFTMLTGAAACDSGTRLSHNTGIVLAGANVVKGNNSATSNNGTTYIAACLEEITAGVAAQNYTTSTSGNWTIVYQ